LALSLRSWPSFSSSSSSQNTSPRTKSAREAEAQRYVRQCQEYANDPQLADPRLTIMRILACDPDLCHECSPAQKQVLQRMYDRLEAEQRLQGRRMSGSAIAPRKNSSSRRMSA
jgi:hypothetical protein